MSIDLANVNWLAVLAAAVLAFLLGGIWYAPLFGKLWVKVHGYDEAAVAAMAKSQARAFGLMFAGELVMAVGLAVLLAQHAQASAAMGAMFGALVWLAAGLPETIMQNAAHRRSLPAFAIDAGHQLVYLVAAGALLGAWR